MKLKTFIHVSDIHISDARMDAQVAKLYALVPKLDGFLGHSYKSLTLLDPFFADLKRDEAAELILTGDVTRVGGTWEFATAAEYLGNELQPPKGYFVGLRDIDWSKLAIPGNHDHYPGIPLLVGGPTASLAAIFPKMPQVVRMPLASSTGHWLTFLLINTDADVSPWGSKRLAARGSFVSELGKLKAVLGPQQGNEIRILCLHHSRAHRGVTLEIDRASRDELTEFIVKQGIAVLLSGHIHAPPLVKLSTAVAASGDSADYLEARCGTTTQRNLFNLPYYWRNIPALVSRKKQGHWSNTLLVHRLIEEHGEIIWESELFLEGPSDFQLATAAQSFSMVNPRVRVWPAPVK